MTPYPKQRTRTALSQVHRVKQYGGRFINVLNGVRLTDKVMYTEPLVPDFDGFGFSGNGVQRVHRRTEYTMIHDSVADRLGELKRKITPGPVDPAVTCGNCDYEWDYSGELINATCPSCQNKVPVEAEG